FFVNRDGDYMYDDLSWWDLTDTAAIMDVSLRRFSTFGFDGLEQIRLWGGGWGEILLHDGESANNVTAKLTANQSVGGQLTLSRSDGLTMANLTSSDGGRLGLTGPLGGGFLSEKIILDARTSGDISVMLPDSSINADEILDEPGTATVYNNDIFFGTSVANEDSISITVPAPGYVIVQASGYIRVSHNGTSSGLNTVRASLSRASATLDFNNFLFWTMDNGNAQVYTDNFALVLTDAVSAGTHKYYFVGHHQGGAGITSAEARDLHLTATYYPTAYGAVVASAPPPPGGDTQTSATAEGPSNSQLIDYRPIIEAKQAERIKKLEDEVRELRDMV
ncbi:MAG: hypothetical protein D6800_14825, partial [Candidatus Zixiibacteriota bacterium]